MRYVSAVISWAIAAWMCFIFLGSLPYKFSAHPDTQHIFSTIGNWLKGLLGDGIGDLFTKFGAYGVGSFELLTSIVLLLPAAIWLIRLTRKQSMSNTRRKFHRIGGLLATVVMMGAVFFHLVSPLGIEVLHEGKSDGGSLFYSALSIVILGIVLFFVNGDRDESA
ncbi:MAG: hypothetical protein V3U65_00615 [Granulosicoccaceae bacterium]